MVGRGELAVVGQELSARARAPAPRRGRCSPLEHRWARRVGFAEAHEGTKGTSGGAANGVCGRASFSGGSKEQYDATVAAVHPGADQLPEGQTFHAAGSSPGGWTIFAVHDSQESWERFRDSTLLPRLQEGVEGGFTGPPQETTVDVYKLLP